MSQASASALRRPRAAKKSHEPTRGPIRLARRRRPPWPRSRSRAITDQDDFDTERFEGGAPAFDQGRSLSRTHEPFGDPPHARPAPPTKMPATSRVTCRSSERNRRARPLRSTRSPGATNARPSDCARLVAEPDALVVVRIGCDGLSEGSQRGPHELEPDRPIACERSTAPTAKASAGGAGRLALRGAAAYRTSRT